MSSGAQTLPVGAGYGVVVGVGFFFAFVMMGITYLQNRYTKFSTKSSEEFNTASRSVKPGLIASGIVSAWTWAATLLQSSTVAYTYGVAGMTSFLLRKSYTAVLIVALRPLLVCCRGHCPNLHVLNPSLQGQDECTKMSHLP